MTLDRAFPSPSRTNNLQFYAVLELCLAAIRGMKPTQERNIQRLPLRPDRQNHGGMPDRPTKITFADMRDMGVRGVLIYCQDHRCRPLIALKAKK